MTEPGNGEKRRQAENLLYDLHEIVWDDAVSLLMELLARAETAEKREAEKFDEATKFLLRAEAAEKELALKEMETALHVGDDYFKARAEAAEKRVEELEQTICGGTFTSAVHRAMARYHIETADLLDRAKLEAKP